MRMLMAAAVILTSVASAAIAQPIVSETLAPPPGVAAAKLRPATTGLPLPPRPPAPTATIPARPPTQPISTTPAPPPTPPVEASTQVGLAPSLLGRSQPGQSAGTPRP